MRNYLINFGLFIFGMFLLLSSGFGGYLGLCWQPTMAVIGGIFCIFGIIFQFIYWAIFWVINKFRKNL